MSLLGASQNRRRGPRILRRTEKKKAYPNVGPKASTTAKMCSDTVIL